MRLDEQHANGWNRWWKGSNEWIKIIKEPNNWHICTLYFMVDNSIKTKFKTIVRTNECGIPLKVNTKWIYWNWVIFIRFSAFTFLFVLFGFYARINFRCPSGLMKRRRHFTKFDTTQAQTESLQFLCKCLRYRRNRFLWVRKGKTMRHNVQCKHAAILLYIFLLSSISIRESTNCQDARRVKRKIPMKITHSFLN